MALSPQQFEKEKAEGYVRQMQGRGPTGIFTGPATDEARQAGAKQATVDKAKIDAEAKMEQARNERRSQKRA